MIAAALALTAVELSPSVRAMIDTAYRSGDDKVIDAVVGVAKASFPDMLGEIEARAKEDADALEVVRTEARDREQARIADARFLDLWKGEIEVGGSRSTGSNSALALYGAASFERDGLKWRQKLSGRIDFQQTAGVTTADRFVAAYQPQYKFDPRFYAFGLVQHERDRFLGYDSRETGGAGLGYSAVVRTNLHVDFEGGPALRRTNYVESPTRTTIAGRASVAIRWALGPNLSLTLNAAVYVEDRDTTATSMTALDTKLIGALKARLSYNVQYERNLLGVVDRLDTVSRATLVYGF